MSVKLRYTSTKEYASLGPVNYRQWRADSHCKYWHGYALSFKFYFEAETLDARNWVMDYGGLRPLKDLLETWFDHKTLVAEDDPELEFHKEAERRGLCQLTIVAKTGCEGLAEFLIQYVNEQFLPLYGDPGRVVCRRVEVRETAANMAYAEWEDNDNANAG
jgi:6-pyruvoyltetrahydropterin/6-carboxytetrahydropterin synthase